MTPRDAAQVAATMELVHPGHACARERVLEYFAALEQACKFRLFDLRMPDKFEAKQYGTTLFFVRMYLERQVCLGLCVCKRCVVISACGRWPQRGSGGLVSFRAPNGSSAVACIGGCCVTAVTHGAGHSAHTAQQSAPPPGDGGTDGMADEQ